MVVLAGRLDLSESDRGAMVVSDQRKAGLGTVTQQCHGCES